MVLSGSISYYFIVGRIKIIIYSKGNLDEKYLIID